MLSRNPEERPSCAQILDHFQSISHDPRAVAFGDRFFYRDVDENDGKDRFEPFGEDFFETDANPSMPIVVSSHANSIVKHSQPSTPSHQDIVFKACEAQDSSLTSSKASKRCQNDN